MLKAAMTIQAHIMGYVARYSSATASPHGTFSFPEPFVNDVLHTHRKQYRKLLQCIVVIQKNYRAFYWRRKFLLLRWAALTFQKRLRGQLARRAYSRLLEERRRRKEAEEEEQRRRMEEEMERSDGPSSIICESLYLIKNASFYVLM